MNFDISSDSDDGQDMTFAERAKARAFGGKIIAAKNRKSPKRKKPVLSHAFSDSDSEVALPSPKKGRGESVCLTPPPAYAPSPTRMSANVLRERLRNALDRL